jgi:hypothetical protein
MQVRSTTVLNVADPDIFTMVVNDFSNIEMNLTREQHAHYQGMHPELEPILSPASHLDRFALSWFGLNRLPKPNRYS